MNNAQCLTSYKPNGIVSGGFGVGNLLKTQFNLTSESPANATGLIRIVVANWFSNIK